MTDRDMTPAVDRLAAGVAAREREAMETLLQARTDRWVVAAHRTGYGDVVNAVLEVTDDPLRASVHVRMVLAEARGLTPVQAIVASGRIRSAVFAQAREDHRELRSTDAGSRVYYAMFWFATTTEL